MQAVILAAGESSRFWPLNYRHKTLTRILGRPLISFLVQDLKLAGIKDIVIVQDGARSIEKELADKSLRYAIQEEPTGTGDAILAAEKLVRDRQFFVLNADDTDVKENIKVIKREFRRGKSKAVLLASRTKTPHLFGILKTRGKKVLEVIEKPKPGREPSNLKNDNFFLFSRDFFDYLKRVSSHPFSLIYALNLYAKENPVAAVISKKETMSLKLPWDLLPILEAKLNSPDFKTKIAKSVKVARNVIIEGKVFIGDGVTIGENSIIKGPCFIGDRCQIRANNFLQGPLNLEEDLIIRSFSELKNCIIERGNHIHRCYLSDSIIGENCRFGAGFISANRRIDRDNIYSTVKGVKIDTGLTRFGVIMGNNTRFGINVGTMPGVFVGSNCLIGPGSVIFENMSDNTKIITKFQTQILKSRKQLRGNHKG